MKRRLTLLVGVLFVLAMMAGPAAAQVPDHGHMLIQDPVVEFLEEGPLGTGVYLTGFRKCVDLAGGSSITLKGHHSNVHMGTAGEMLFAHAGHAVVPTADLVPWEDCADLEANFLPLLIPEA